MHLPNELTGLQSAQAVTLLYPWRPHTNGNHLLPLCTAGAVPHCSRCASSDVHFRAFAGPFQPSPLHITWTQR